MAAVDFESHDTKMTEFFEKAKLFKIEAENNHSQYLKLTSFLPFVYFRRVIDL